MSMDFKQVYKALENEMHSYYKSINQSQLPESNFTIRKNIVKELDDFLENNSTIHPSLLKAKQIEVIADKFEPVIFPHSPFFYEMGLRAPKTWGFPHDLNTNLIGNIGSWMHGIKKNEVCNSQENNALQYWCTYNIPDKEFERSPYWNANGIGFDSDHHCLGYTRLLKEGISGVIKRIDDRLNQECTSDQQDQLKAMIKGLRAVITVANKFALRAEKMLKDENDPVICQNLNMIIEAAKHIPENPPRNFYEGLAFLWFMRETTGTLESIGVSVIGHPDRHLIKLYLNDMEQGNIDREKAEELIALWMLPTDVKTFTRESEWPETSTCMTLGGCDENGDIVWNDLTRLFIKVHHKYNLINPKLNCRFSSKAPQEYLELMAEIALKGHNHFAFMNDDVLIPANQRYGKTEEDARLYVNGGCQETMCEGVEHSAGAYFYYNMPAVISDWFRGYTPPKACPEIARKAIPHNIGNPETFEAFYTELLDTLKSTLMTALTWMNEIGSKYWRINPCPMFSSTLEGCIDNATDYTKGGAKYNLSGITLVGLGDIINTLNAIKYYVYENKITTLEELKEAIKTNWEGREELRQQFLSQNTYGHGKEEADKMAARFTADMAAYCRSCKNERGSIFQPSFFVYYAYKNMGDRTRATPDGRRNGDIFCQGIAPGRNNAPQSLPQVFKTIQNIDFTDYPGNAVLDIQLPTGNSITPNALAATMRTFAQLGGPTLQLNCVSVNELKEAQVKPLEHENLTVRISGLSACFVQLKKCVQDEIINRAQFTF